MGPGGFDMGYEVHATPHGRVALVEETDDEDGGYFEISIEEADRAAFTIDKVLKRRPHGKLDEPLVVTLAPYEPGGPEFELTIVRKNWESVRDRLAQVSAVTFKSIRRKPH